MAYVEEVMNEYRNSLRDLHCNSKPLINVLTMLAEENEQHAPEIVKVIEDEILKAKANRKLPMLYLIDSIIKNLPKTSYKSLFSKNLVQTFTSVFEQVDEKTRASMFKLRQTWTALFPNAKLYSIDVKIQSFLDPAWPITASAPEQTSIHVNPKFLTKSESESSPSPELEPEPQPEMSPQPETPMEEEDNLEEQESMMRQQLIAKQQELLRLQQERLELELAEAKEKLNKQKKKNASASHKSASVEEPALPDTTVQPAIPEPAPHPRDPRIAGRDPYTRDPRLRGRANESHSHTSSDVPHSTVSTGPYIPPDIGDSSKGSVPKFGGVDGGVPFTSQNAIPSPFMQSGQLHVNPGFLHSHHAAPAESHFTGEIYHPDSSDDSDAKKQDPGSSNKQKLSHKEPSTNRRDPRQARNKAGERSGNNNYSNNRNTRDNDINRNSDYNRNLNRSSKERDRDPRHSRSPHSSSISPRSSDGTRDNKTDSKTKDIKQGSHHEHRKSVKHEEFSLKKQDEHIGPNSHKSPSKHKSPPDKRDGKRKSKDWEKSPDSAKSPKHTKTSDKLHVKTDKDAHIDSKTDSQTAAKESKTAKRTSKERSLSPSKGKVRNKNENAKQSGSDENVPVEGKETVAPAVTPKRELEKDEQEQDKLDENVSKKPRIDVTEEKPFIVEGADVLGKIQEDISDLFGGEDQDYRAVDPKGLPLKSPSCKGWDKFKADHPDQYAYDIELKKQRSEQMDVDQKSPEEPQDIDYRINRQQSWPAQTVSEEARRASIEQVAIPVELSIEHHAEILIQAHKQLQEGKISHEEHQTLLQNLGELMTIQKLQEENRRVEEAQRLVQEQPLEDEDIRDSSLKTEFTEDRDLRKSFPQHPEADIPKLHPTADGTETGSQFNRPPQSKENVSPEKQPGENIRKEKNQKEGSPLKAGHKEVPEFERQGPLHNLYPEKPPEPLGTRWPPQKANLPAGENVGRVQERDHQDRHPGFINAHKGDRQNHPELCPDERRIEKGHLDGNRPFKGPPNRRDSDPLDRGDIGGHERRDFEPLDEYDRFEMNKSFGPPHRHPDGQNMGLPYNHEVGPPDRFDNIRRDINFEDEYDSQQPDKMNSELLEREGHGLPNQRNHRPSDRMDYGSERRDIGSFDRKNRKPPDHMGRGFLDRREMSPDRMDWGPPERFKHVPPDGLGMGPPGRRDQGPAGRMGSSERRDHGPPDREDMGSHDRMDMIGRHDHKVLGRRGHGPTNEQDLGPPEMIAMDPLDRRRHRPPDRRDIEPYDKREEPREGRNFGPPDRSGPHDRRHIRPPDRRHAGPDWQDLIPPDERGGQDLRGHGPPDKMNTRFPERSDFQPTSRIDIGPPDSLEDGPPDRRRMELPHNRDYGSPERRLVEHGMRDHRHLTRQNRGSDREDHLLFDRPRNAPPEFRDDMPHERDFRPPDSRDHRLLEPVFTGPHNQRVAPHDERGNGPPDWKKDMPPDQNDPGLPEGRFQENAGPKEGKDTVPHERHGPAWPLGQRGVPFNPGRAELEQTISERRTPPFHPSGAPLDPSMKPAIFIDDIPKHGNVPPDRKNKPSDRLKGDEKTPPPDKQGFQEKKGPLLPTPTDTPPDLKPMEGQAKQGKSEVKPLTDSQKDKKHIPALLDMDIKPTPDLLVKGVKVEPGVIDHNTGMGEWHPVKHQPKIPSSPDGDNKPIKKRDAGKGKGHDEKRPPKRTDLSSGIGPDFGHPDVKRHPNRRDHPETGLDKDLPESRRHPNRTDGPLLGPDAGHSEGRRHNRRDGPPGLGPDGNRPPERWDGPPGLGPDGNRPPERWDGPPGLGPDGNRPPERWDGPPGLGPDGNRPPERWDGPPGLGPDGNRPPERWNGPPGLGPDGNKHPDRWDGPPGFGPKGNRHPEGWDGPPGLPPDGNRPLERWDGPPNSGPIQPFPPGPRGPLIPQGRIIDGPHGPPDLRMAGPDRNFPIVEDDQRWTSFSNMGPDVTEEIVIGNKNYAIKLGDRPRIIRFFKDNIEVYADPSKRGIVIDGNLMYKFGERVKDVEIRGRTVRMFYHGKPVDLWIEGQNFEVRVDAPPRNIEINGKNHKIQIDGRDMMLLIDKSEKGTYGGPPRFIYIDEDRMELRFDPPPRHILIDGKLCELMLSMKRPCVNIEGKLHGIRFDGPPREVVINNQVFNIHTDRAVKVKVANKLHYIALGGPCHELIVDGKWYEMKFSEPPKEINVGNKTLMVHLPGKPPEVKILPEILPNMPEAPFIPQADAIVGPGPMRPLEPGGRVIRPPGPLEPQPRPLVPRGPNERLRFPMPAGPLRPELRQLGAFPVGQPPQSAEQQILQIAVPGSQAQPRPVMAQPPVSAGPQGGMPNVLSGLFGNLPQPPLVPSLGPGPAPAAAPPPAAGAPAMDINTLLSRLIATGIIKKEDKPGSPASTPSTAVSGGEVKKEETKTGKAQELMNVRKKPVKQDTLEDIPDVTEMEMSQLKELHNGVIQRLYLGIQCSSCGMRFVLEDEEKTEKYREHLDWHFRQNRREKDETKVAKYRQWYYGINDWIQYEEITDTEESSRSTFFEKLQTVQATPAPAPNNMSFALITVPEGATVVRCPAASGNDSDDLCAICHEPFEQFWDEEHEEWHLRDAIRVNDQTYHPICYEDHTDVSEGTPSPSTLPMLPPDFSARKTLSYDETSQDTPNTSFEGSREVVTAEPSSDETDSKMTEDISESVIVITESPVKSVPQTTIKSEPMDTSDSAIVKQEKDTTEIGATVIETDPSSNVEADSVSGSVIVKTEGEISETSAKDSKDQESSGSVTTSQEKSDSVSSENVTATEVVMVTEDAVPIKSESVVERKSVIATEEATAGSPATQGSGGSTPVQDERSCTPVKDECPGTPVQDEPMVE